MKILYQIQTPYNANNLFFWADSSEEALEMARQQGLDRDIEAVAERVWANNINMKYRGYVIDENYEPTERLDIKIGNETGEE